MNPVVRLLAFWRDELATTADWRTGRGRLLRRALVTFVAEGITLYVLAVVLPGLDVRDLPTAFGGAVVLALINALVRPVLVYLTLPFTVLTFGLLTLGLNALMLALAGWIVPGMEVRDPLTAFGVALGLAMINTVVTSILELNEDESFYRNVVRRVVRRAAGTEPTEVPGVVIVQIDGLAGHVLRGAVRTGVMPHVGRLVRGGSHRLVTWDCGLPSMTSSAQAGILHGNSWDIPAFRWYEKESGRLLVSNRPADAAEIERRVSDGDGLLARGGSSVGNLLSGDAPRTVLTMSSIAELGRGIRDRSRDFYVYFVNPYAFVRGVVNTLREIAAELAEARRQRLRGVEPRVPRGGIYPLLRAATVVLFRDLTVTLALEDIYRGVPVVYVDLVGYDEVAHHAGPERPEALRALESLDEQVETLARAAASAPRPYEFVVLSDHGQTQGATFLQRHGQTIEQLVRSFVQPEHEVASTGGTTEDWGHLNAILSETVASTGMGARTARRTLRRRIRDGYVELGSEREARLAARDTPADGREGAAPAVEEAPEVVVAVSGNLAHVYLNAIAGRATVREIEAAYPHLLQGLAGHAGIGFIAVTSEVHGPLAIGRDGVRHLRDDRVEGEDPLAGYGGRAPEHVARLVSFPHSGDIVVNSAWDPQAEEVQAFEELVGSHGGLGGAQTRPFVLFPAGWKLADRDIVGPDALHAVLRGWLDEVVYAADAPVAAEEEARAAARGAALPDPA